MERSRIQVLAKSKSAVYLVRANNLLRTMELAERDANPDGAATCAVQAAIALGDAYTIYFRQERCRGQDHHEVLALIARCRAPNSSEIASNLSRILSRKSEVEYEERPVSSRDARELAKRARALSLLVHADLR